MGVNVDMDEDACSGKGMNGGNSANKRNKKRRHRSDDSIHHNW